MKVPPIEEIVGAAVAAAVVVAVVAAVAAAETTAAETVAVAPACVRGYDPAVGVIVGQNGMKGDPVERLETHDAVCVVAGKAVVEGRTAAEEYQRAQKSFRGCLASARMPVLG